jgi:hypothetical protein
MNTWPSGYQSLAMADAPKACGTEADPRRCIPNARTLATMNDTLRNKIGSCCGKAITTFALAAIAVFQDRARDRGEAPMLDNLGARAPDKRWQTFSNLTAAEPNKPVTQPVTVTVDVKIALTALFVRTAELVERVGKLPAADPLSNLAEAPWQEADIIKLMLKTTRARHIMRADPLCRELLYPLAFRKNIEALTSIRSLNDLGAAEVPQLFLDFIKVIAWHAAVRAYEHEHLTINRATFYSILASMEAGLSEDDALVVRNVLSFVRVQNGLWDTAVAQAKAKKQIVVQGDKADPKTAPPAAPPAAPLAVLASLLAAEELDYDEPVTP